MKIEEAINSKFKSSQQKAIVNIRYTSNWLSNIQNTFMSKHDLTMPQFNVLRILRGANSSLMMQTIKERMVEKSPNTTRLLDKLELKGFISRCTDIKDKRAVNVSISQLGLAILSKLDSEIKEEEFLVTNLSDEEAEILSSLLDKIRSSSKIKK